mgnify:CR=1 FL=1
MCITEHFCSTDSMPQPPERCFGIVWCYPLLFHCDIFVPRAHNAVLDMRLSPVDGILVDGHLGDGGIRGDVVHDRDKQIFDHAAQTARTALALHRLAGDGMQGCIGKDQLGVIQVQQLDRKSVV